MELLSKETASGYTCSVNGSNARETKVVRKNESPFRMKLVASECEMPSVSHNTSWRALLAAFLDRAHLDDQSWVAGSLLYLDRPTSNESIKCPAQNLELTAN